MNKRARGSIDRIMSDAFTQAADVLEVEIRKLLDARPDLYSRFVLAVGWGPMLFDTDGRIVHTYLPSEQARYCARARRLMDYATEFYDRYGADNREVIPSLAAPRAAPVMSVNPKRRSGHQARLSAINPE